MSYALPLWARESDEATPILAPRNTPIRANNTARALPAASHRCRTTSAAQRLHPRLARSSWRIFGQSMRGPMPPRIAGVNVSVTSTLATGISAPPMPMLRMNGTGNTINANRPIATVTPLNTIACPAVCIATTTASWFSRP